MKKIIMPLLLSLLIAVPVAAVSASELKFDMPSEEYANYMELTPEEQSKRTPPMKARLRSDENQVFWTSGRLPDRFDLRDVDTDGDGIGDTSYVTPLRHQLNSNDCWAFSFVSAAESRWKYQTGEDIDLSELHIDYSMANKLKAGQFNPEGGRINYGSGGQALMAAAYAARGSGLVLESELPFRDDGANAYLSSTYISPSFRASAIKVTNYMNSQYEITDMMINRIKADLMNGSAISINIYHDFPYENDLNGSFYNNSTDFGQANHAISIVGWDDTYPAENFNIDPGRDGAWIVRDNYEEEEGDKGYRYLSYMDKSAYDNNVQVLQMEDYRGTEPPYDNRYYHDSSWFTDGVGYEDSDNITYGMNVFDKQDGEETVTSINLAFNGPTDYDAYILDYVTDPESLDCSGAEPVASGHSPYAGYFDIDLDTPVTVSGDKFAVIVKYHSDDTFYSVPVEQKMKYPYVWYNYYSTAPSKSSYTSPDGATWEEISTAEIQANCTIKAFTKNVGNRAKITFDISTPETTVYVMDSEGKRMTANTDGTYFLSDGSYSYTAQKEGYADQTEAFTVIGSSDMQLSVSEPTKQTGTAPYVNNEILYSMAPFDDTPVTIEFSMGTGTKAAQSLSIYLGDYTGIEGEDYFIRGDKIIFSKDAFPDEELYENQNHMIIFTVVFNDAAETVQKIYLGIEEMDPVKVINTYLSNHLDASKDDIKAYVDTLIDTQIVFGDDFEITPSSITGKIIVTQAGESAIQDYTGYSRALSKVQFISERRDGFMYKITSLLDNPHKILSARYDGKGMFEAFKEFSSGYIIASYNEDPYTIKFVQWSSLGSMVPLMDAYEIHVPAK